MFHVKSYLAFEVLDWWERTKACLQLCHELRQIIFGRLRNLHFLEMTQVIHTHTRIYAYVYKVS